MEASTSTSASENRLVVAVTGANSGLGFGLCHRLLRQLSVADLSISPSDPPLTLTLILACRSAQKANIAIKALYREHDVGLAARRIRGHKDRAGWRDGLRIVYEQVDMDAVGGETGVMAFAERIRNKYPHLSTLVLNAGGGAFTGIDWIGATREMLLNPKRALTSPNYIKSTRGFKSADGERGGVWGVNVLSGYILAKELQAHLEKSPASLPYPPRIIYVSSKQASSECLPSPDPLSDPQLLSVVNPYDASKYVADLVFSHLDLEMSRITAGEKSGEVSNGAAAHRSIRCLLADPGIASTGLMVPYLPWIMQIAMVLLMHFCRILGSSVHTCTANAGAVAMYFLATAPDALLDPPRPPPSLKTSTSTASLRSNTTTSSSSRLLQPAPAPCKYLSRATRWGTAYVRSGQVGDWDRYGEHAAGFADECDRVYREWKSRDEKSNGHAQPDPAAGRDDKARGVKEPKGMLP